MHDFLQFPEASDDFAAPAAPRPLGQNPQACDSAADASSLAPSFLFIAARWSRLPPHIREAIVTLVDCSCRGDAAAGGEP
jgi:hypothetical protein